MFERITFLVISIPAKYSISSIMFKGNPPTDDTEDACWFSEADLAEDNVNRKTHQLLTCLFNSQKITQEGNGGN